MQTSNRRNWLGIILVVLGLMFLMDNFDFPFFHFRPFIFSWSTILLILGIIMVVNHKDHLVGYIFLVFGVIGTFHHALPYFFDFDFSDLWPIILLVVGLWMILKRNGSNGKEHRRHFDMHQTTASASSADYIEEDGIFNSIKRVITSENFKGGRLSSIFGECKIDLSASKLAPGENTLEVTNIFGGVTIRVPVNWRIILNTSSVFGGFDDKRFGTFDPQNASEGILVIKGSNIFGGGKLIN
jgi:predicted membrane protein